MDIHIREFEAGDWPAVWEIIQPVFQSGETYAVDPEITEIEAFRFWTSIPTNTYIAESTAGEILGTYTLKPNQAGPGAHICNCGYIVSEAARGRGIASKLCEHSQGEALKKGFKAMQFNLVVSTNAGAIRLWERHGFKIVGTIPDAFQHPNQGLVDAHILYKKLVEKPH